MNQSPFRSSDPTQYALTTLNTHWRVMLHALLPLLVPIVVVASLWRSTGLFTDDIKNFDNMALNIFMPVLLIITCGMFFYGVPWSFATYARLSLDIYDGKPIDPQTIALSTKKHTVSIFKALCLMLFIGAFILGAALITSTFTIHAIAALGALWLLVKVSFFSFFIVDKGLPAKASLQSSYRLTRNNFWNSAIISISFASLHKGLSAIMAVCDKQIHAGFSYMFSTLLGTTGMNIAVFIMDICGICISVFFDSILFCFSGLAGAYMYRKLIAEQEKQSVVE